MLIHKGTMGVLDVYWTGKYRKDCVAGVLPVMAEYTLAGTELSGADWWEVPRGSALGRKALRYYPCCTPVLGADGSLVDVVPWPAWKVKGLPEPPPEPERKMTRKGAKKGHQHRRKAGLLEYLL